MRTARWSARRRMPGLVAVLSLSLATAAAAPVRHGPTTGRVAGHVRDGQGSADRPRPGPGRRHRALGAHRHRRRLPAAGGARGRASRSAPRGSAIGPAELGGTRAGRGHADAQLHPRRPSAVTRRQAAQPGSCETKRTAREGQVRRSPQSDMLRGPDRQAAGAPSPASRRRPAAEPWRWAARAGQHRGLQRDRREPLPRGAHEPGVDLLDRRGRRLVQQRAPLPEPGHAAARGRRAARGAGQLLPVSLPRPQRRAPVRGRRPRSARAPGRRTTGSCASVCRPAASPTARPAAEQPGLPDRRVGLDAVARQAAAGQAGVPRAGERAAAAGPRRHRRLRRARRAWCCRRRAASDKATILEAIDRLEAGGSTAGGAGHPAGLRRRARALRSRRATTASSWPPTATSTSA